MTATTTLKARQDVPRDVVPGDHVYYRHPAHGVGHGEVLATGQHGFRCRSSRPDAAEDQVLWDAMLGHKARKQRQFILVDHGEDGALARDENGTMQFIRGNVKRPVPESMPMAKAHAELSEAFNVSALELARAQAEQAAVMGAAIEKLAKALEHQSGQLSALIGALSPPNPQGTP